MAAFLNQHNLLDLSIRLFTLNCIGKVLEQEVDAVPKQPFYLWPGESHKYVSYK